MTVSFRNYSDQPFFTDDYHKVRDFLIRINRKNLIAPNFTWGRWEWMITHSMLDHTALNKIGIWETNDEIIGLATYESTLGEGYFSTAEDYEYLKPEMLDYAFKELCKDGKLRALIDNNDRTFQRIAQSRGFRPTQNNQLIAAIDIDRDISYALPEGFKIHSMADGWDFNQYNEVMWRGFNYEGEAHDYIESSKIMLSSPTINPDLILAVVSPNGNYVSHCGMWYMQGDNYALIEPVATDPDYRMLGLGRAVVLEAVMRCGKLGAKQALVGSSQQFYYNIGFYPIYTETWWELKY